VVTAFESGRRGNPSAALVTAAATALARRATAARGTPPARRFDMKGGSKSTTVGQRGKARSAEMIPAAAASTVTLRCSAALGSRERRAISSAACGHTAANVPSTSQKRTPRGPPLSATATSTRART